MVEEQAGATDQVKEDLNQPMVITVGDWRGVQASIVNLTQTLDLVSKKVLEQAAVINKVIEALNGLSTNTQFIDALAASLIAMQDEISTSTDTVEDQMALMVAKSAMSFVDALPEDMSQVRGVYRVVPNLRANPENPDASTLELAVSQYNRETQEYDLIDNNALDENLPGTEHLQMACRCIAKYVMEVNPVPLDDDKEYLIAIYQNPIQGSDDNEDFAPVTASPEFAGVYVSNEPFDGYDFTIQFTVDDDANPTEMKSYKIEGSVQHPETPELKDAYVQYLFDLALRNGKPSDLWFVKE